MVKASENIFPQVILDAVTSDPAAPSNDNWKLYAKANGIYARSSNAVFGPFVTGSALANPMTTTGDVIYSSDNSGTAARLAIGSNGTVARSTGTLPAWAVPVGFEYSYAQRTSTASITATTEAAADTVLTADAVTFDGSTNIFVEFYAPRVDAQATSGAHVVLYLYDGSTSQGLIWQGTNNANVTLRFGGVFIRVPVRAPSAAAHTYSIRASTGSGTATIAAGIGGAGQYRPAYIRVVRG